VDVQCPEARQVNHRLREEMPVGDDDAQLRRERTELGEKGLPARPVRLEHGDPLLEGDLLDR